jgi:5'-3' exonuclease
MVFDGLNTFIRSFGATPAYNEDGDHVLEAFPDSYIQLAKQLETLNLSRCIIVFDGRGGSAKRKRIYKDYKGNRANKTKLRRHDHHDSTLEQEQESMRHQFSRLISYLDNLPVTFISMDGIEADDTIAYIAQMYEDTCKKMTIVSTDRDFYQLVDKSVHCKFGHQSKRKCIMKKHCIEEFGVHPANYVVYTVSFTGDASDNIPGVRWLWSKDNI